MSAVMEEEIKRWTARRKSALVLEIIQGKTTVAEASRAFDITPSEIETWVDEGKRGLENALRAKPEDVREQYERQLKELQEAYGEATIKGDGGIFRLKPGLVGATVPQGIWHRRCRYRGQNGSFGPTDRCIEAASCPRNWAAESFRPE